MATRNLRPHHQQPDDQPFYNQHNSKDQPSHHFQGLDRQSSDWVGDGTVASADVEQ
jgi:hypothetical protein